MDWAWWGDAQPYDLIAERQRILRRAISEQGADECVAILSHSPVITVGRRPVPGAPSPTQLAERGIGFSRSERGGLATYHGPGQMMAYALVDVHKRRIKVRCFIQALEEASIRFLANKSVGADRKAGAPGIWVGDKKIAAVGVHFSRGVSMHGVAMNLSPDLSAFQLISPCGFSPNSVTSLSQITGKKWSVREEAPEFAGILMDCIKERSAP